MAKPVYVAGIRITPVVKRFHKSGLVYEASIRETRRSKAVLRPYREGKDAK